MARKENFETALGKLEEIVQLLEEGELPLEECLSQYREGLRLHKVCQERLAKVEEELSRFLEDDGTTTVLDPANPVNTEQSASSGSTENGELPF